VSKLIESQAEFQQLANERLDEAKALLNLGKWGGAYYLAGYAVELALKACIIKRPRGPAMDQNVLVTDEIESGHKLVERLVANGFDVRLAFWVKESDAGQWFLYLASPMVDEQGPAAAYRVVGPVVDSMPELGIDPFAVKVVGLNDSMTTAAQAVIRPRISDSPFAVQNPKPYPGITRFGGSTLGGVSVDGAYIYPPLPRAVSA